MKRITILLGAGAMIEATGLGTGVLTDKVFESCKKYKLKSGEEILREFAKDFAKKHSKTPFASLLKRTRIDLLSSKFDIHEFSLKQNFWSRLHVI